MNEAKERILGVSPEILNGVGAVSAECARAMAEGALKRSNATYALSTTGVAGPGGGTEKTPVGTVFVALAGHDFETRVLELHLRGDRTRVRSMSCLRAMNLLRLRLDELDGR